MYKILIIIINSMVSSGFQIVLENMLLIAIHKLCQVDRMSMYELYKIVKFTSFTVHCLQQIVDAYKFTVY